MANLDSLDIQLKVTDSATGSLDKFIKKLTEVNLSLNNYASADSKYTGAMKNLSNAFDGLGKSIDRVNDVKLKNIASGLRSVSSAMDKLNGSGGRLGLDQVTTSVRGLDDLINRETIKAMDNLGVKGKENANAIKQAMLDLYNTIDSKGNFDARKIAPTMLPALQQGITVEGQGMSDLQKVYDYVQSTNKSGNRISMGIDKSNWADTDYRDMRNSLGKAFSSSIQGAGGDISTYVREMQTMGIGNWIDITGSNEAVFEQLVSAMRDARAEQDRLNQSYRQSEEVMVATGSEAHRLFQAIYDLRTANNQLAESERNVTTSIPETNAFSSIERLGNSMQTFNNVPNTQGVTSFANAIARLSNSNIANLGSVDFQTISTKLSTFTNTMANAESVSRNTTSFINAIAKLSNAGSNTSKSADGLDILRDKLSKFITSMSRAPIIATETISIVGGISQLANAGKKARTGAEALSELGDRTVEFIEKLADAPEVDDKIQRLVGSIGQIASAGRSANGAFRNIAGGSGGVGGRSNVGSIVNSLIYSTGLSGLGGNTMRGALTGVQIGGVAGGYGAAIGGVIGGLGGGAMDAGKGLTTMGKGLASVVGNVTGLTTLTNGIKEFSGNVIGATTSTKGFVSAIGMFYAKCFMLIRAVKLLWKTIGSANDYIETYNYFNKSYEQLSGKGWKEAGYRSAKDYVDSFKTRSEELFTKMSGYNIGKNGDLTSNGLKSLAMNPTDVMNYQAQFTQISDSMGVASDTGTKLSNIMTMLGSDIASLRNVDFDMAWQNLSSGVLAGQSRVLDKYGINVRTAALNQKLLELNIDTTAQKLGQQDKALLRAIIALDSTRGAWGDLAQTINTPANQIRMLQNNVKQLGLAIGTVLAQGVAKVLPYLNALVIVAKRAFEYLARILHFDLSSLSGQGDGGEVYSDIADGAEDASTGIDKATSSAKKFNKQLQGFDELNNLTSNDGNSSGGNGGKGGVGDLGATAALTKAFNKLADEYQKKWNDAFKKMENSAENLATRIQKALLKAWKIGSGFDLGAKLGQWVNKGVGWLYSNLGKYTTKGIRVARLLATTLNGFIARTDWSMIGKTIGGYVRANLLAIDTFISTTDWMKLGSAISRTLNGYIKSGAISQAFKTLGSAIRAAVDLAFGSVTSFDFSKLGEEIGAGINRLLQSMSKVNTKTGLTGYQEISIIITKLINGILSAISSVSSTTEGKALAGSVVQLISSIIQGVDASKISPAIQILFHNFKPYIKQVLFPIVFGLVKESIEKLNVGELKETLKTKISEMSKNVVFGLGIKIKNTATDVWEGFKKKLNAIKPNIKISVQLVTENIKKAWNTIATMINNKLKIEIDSKTALGKSLKQLFGTDKVKLGNLPTFANGGYVGNSGQLFIARERGAELVGNIGGRTGVANNDQIVASVSTGVANAVANVMTPVLSQVAIAIANQDSGETVSVKGLSDGDIVKIVKQEDNRYRKRTGRPLFA